MIRDEASTCQIGDWVLVLEMPDWDAQESPRLLELPDGEEWIFGLACVPITDEHGERVGEDFVWMRFDLADGTCRPHQGPLSPQCGKSSLHVGTSREAPAILYLFAGSNGAGKTTFARAFLTTQFDVFPRFLNADEIARGLSPLSPQSVALKAGKLLLEEIEGCIGNGASFALESTLSGSAQVAILKRAKAAGYQIEIHYLWLPSSELAVRRVAQRVEKGGHDIPAADVHRRYRRSLRNFARVYAPLSDAWFLWKNTSEPPKLILDSEEASLQQLSDLLLP